jgi:hypothetical protein
MIERKQQGTKSTVSEAAVVQVDAQFLGAFAKWRKADISLVMSVRPSGRLYQLGSHWKDLREILYFCICFENLSRHFIFY